MKEENSYLKLKSSQMRALYIFLLVCLQQTVFGQAYYNVVSLKGKLQDNTAGQLIKIGDKVMSSHQLSIGANSYAVLIGSNGVKYVLRPQANQARSEFVAFIEDVISPVSKTGRLSTRGDESESVIDFKNYFGTDSFCIIGSTQKILVNQALYPFSEGYFILRYDSRLGTISKKIAYNRDTLIVSPKDLFRKGNTFIESDKISEVELYFSHRGDTRLITTFKLKFLNPENLKTECSTLIDTFHALEYSEDDTLEEVLLFLDYNYGKLDRDKSIKWLQKEALIK
jgi:hypothetical protein